MENKTLAGVAGVGEVKVKSESQEIIIRMNNKINELYDKLHPIYLDNSTPGESNIEASSPLIHELLNIEHKITQLLEGIRI